ncbi:thiamine ABC transporter substrate-binding protein [Candidatus Halobonum tyrrellensis]|uniref:Thiamine-binding periplasmic protein-like protein n=1 Tax=Candidatus Halobonum tyrrellensis G22 TaxID=1324957 RepID=V4IXP9_9EURY|nr:thiamine ABC transporter substrate-binding protein [Candidatus Halobonum tyrrellensis]ESP87937.1 thiamine-binding periplasmic protein-like protein [Candidatus Halobonum tyrrellensis G22]
MDRRRFLETAGAGGLALVAGCSAEQVETEGSTGAPADGGTETRTATGTESETGTTTGSATAGDETLVVAAYPAFVDAPSTSPGAWLKRRFEEETGATLRYETPDNELNYYIERARQGADFDADVYVGLDTSGLIRVDEQQGSGQFTDPLFAEAGDLAGSDRVKEGLRFDPEGRAVPFDTGYVSLVWNATADGGEFTAPETFESLLDPAYEGDLIAQNPTSSTTGQAFMLHTIERFGADGYLDYWADLRDNDVVVLGSWEDAYAAYESDEAPMVVSYSTDQVYANREDQDLQRHRIRFLNDQGYANPEGMARFADADAPDLARRFMEFALTPEIQAGIAQRNVAFPAIEDAPLPDEYAEYAKEPAEAVTFTYEELKGNLGTWTDDWARRFASG